MAQVSIDTQPLRKARGAFFTPPEISQFITDWAIRTGDDAVLEPSCGEASFLLRAITRIRALGGPRQYSAHQVAGVDLHGPSVETAAQLLHNEGFPANIHVADFFDLAPEPAYDAVVGNPPYVRYQQFSGDARTKGLRAALAQGVRLTRLASSWAPFVVHASTFLKRKGRLGLVLPAELLAVKYAAPIRQFLLQRFKKVRLILFDERVFPGVLEEVVLLLAEGSGGVPTFEVYQVDDLAGLAQLDRVASTWFTPEKDGKWTAALIPGSTFSTYRETSASDGFETLLDWGETY